MPVLSLHNTYSLPSGSASYTLGLSGAPVASSYTYPTVGSIGIGQTGVGNILGTGLTGTSCGLLGTSGLGLSSTNQLSNNLPSMGYNPSSSYSTYTNPLLAMNMNVKLKPLEDLDIGLAGRYGNRGGTPCSPIPPSTWGLDNYTGIDGVNPAFMHSQRPLSRLGGLDLDSKCYFVCLFIFIFFFLKKFLFIYLKKKFSLVFFFVDLIFN